MTDKKQKSKRQSQLQQCLLVARQQPLPIRRLTPRRGTRGIIHLLSPDRRDLIGDHPGHDVQDDSPCIAQGIVVELVRQLLDDIVQRRFGPVQSHDGLLREQEVGIRLAQAFNGWYGVGRGESHPERSFATQEAIPDVFLDAGHG